MVDSRKRDTGEDQPNDGEDVSDSSSTIDSRFNDAAGSEGVSSNPLTDQGGRDFLLGEDMVLRWLQALDMQVLGACRGDERLKPLLKLDVSNGMAEDRLLAHLSQHFKLAEIGMLARCFCIPLVSVRVGKINKEGPLMRPPISYTTWIWRELMEGMLLQNFTTDWDGIVQLLAEGAMTRTKLFLARYTFQALVHGIWRERNSRRHGKTPQTKQHLISFIDKSVRNRIMSIKATLDRSLDDGFQVWLSTRLPH